MNRGAGVVVVRGIKSAVASGGLALAGVGVGSKAGLPSLATLIVIRLPVLRVGVVNCWILGCVVFLFEEVRFGES